MLLKSLFCALAIGLISVTSIANQAPETTFDKIPWKGFSYEGPLLGGLPHGVGVVTTPYGTIEGPFVNGKREGVFRTIENGLVADIITYKNDLRNGPSVTFFTKTRMSSSYTAGQIGYRAGDKKYEGNYVNDKPEGDHYAYRRTNDVLRATSRTTYRNGEVVAEVENPGSGSNFASMLLDTWKQVEKMRAMPPQQAAALGASIGLAQSQPGETTKSVGTSRAAASSCPADLSYLEAQIPTYPDADLQLMRRTILQTRFRDVIASASSMGYTPQSAARESLEAARQADATLKSAESCVNAVSTDPGLLSKLRTGNYNFSSGSISQSCAKAYILAHMNAIANRESAVAMACWATK
jgi:hypothetical protein